MVSDWCIGPEEPEQASSAGASCPNQCNSLCRPTQVAVCGCSIAWPESPDLAHVLSMEGSSMLSAYSLASSKIAQKSAISRFHPLFSYLSGSYRGSKKPISRHWYRRCGCKRGKPVLSYMQLVVSFQPCLYARSRRPKQLCYCRPYPSGLCYSRASYQARA